MKVLPVQASEENTISKRMIEFKGKPWLPEGADCPQIKRNG